MANQFGPTVQMRSYRPPNPKPFPAFMWNAETGERKLFNSAEEVPAKGWLPYHPKDKAKAAAAAEVEKATKPAAEQPNKQKAPPAALSMTRDEIVAALTAGNIEFAKQGSTRALYDLLRSNVLEALEKNKVEYDPKASTAELYTLLTDGPAQ